MPHNRRLMCEAGRFNRFEELITEFRADFDWVTLHLAQCRELTLLRLHEQLDDLHMSPSQRENITRYFEDHY